MHYQLIFLSFFICFYCVRSKEKADSGDASDLGAELVSELRNDANLDLSVDEEYEDLRAELLAYHTALASISARRSQLATACWSLGGICVNYKLCQGARFLTEVPGCKDKHNVCCFRWNSLQVRDSRDQGINTLGLPWSIKQDFGGKGLKAKDEARRLNEREDNQDSQGRLRSLDLAPLASTAGTTKSTCWARGGSCMHIRHCPSLRIDTQVSGCANAFMVCCKNFDFGPPTVGILRTPSEIPIYSSDLEELDGESMEMKADRNTQLMNRVH